MAIGGTQTTNISAELKKILPGLNKPETGSNKITPVKIERDASGSIKSISQSQEPKASPIVQELIKLAEKLQKEEIRTEIISEKNSPAIPANKTDLTANDMLGQQKLLLNGAASLSIVPKENQNGAIVEMKGKEPVHIKTEQLNLLLGAIKDMGKLPEARKVAGVS